MNDFKLGDKVEALDEFGVWSKGKIVDKQGEKYQISFDGFTRVWDHWVNHDELREETKLYLPNKRSRQPKIPDVKRLQRGDKVYLREAGEVWVHEVDPIKGKLIVELDGDKKDVNSSDICSPPIPSTERHEGRPTKRRKAITEHKGSEGSIEALPDVVQDDERSNEKIFLCIYYLRDDGMWLRIGDVVSVEGVGLPFIISRLDVVGGSVSAKLVNVYNSGLREDFVVSCDVSYITVYAGEKVNVKGSVKEKLAQEAFLEFCNVPSSGVGDKLDMRRMLLGHTMRVGLQNGFGNLSCVRLNLGPLDFLLDNKIFNFLSVNAVARFSLVNDGELECLDGILGKGWDYKLGRADDAFFKFITELQLKRSHDLCLTVIAKFSQPQFKFSPSYRVECRKAIFEGREQMENIEL